MKSIVFGTLLVLCPKKCAEKFSSTPHISCWCPATELNSRPSQPPSRPHHTMLHLHPLNFTNTILANFLRKKMYFSPFRKGNNEKLQFWFLWALKACFALRSHHLCSWQLVRRIWFSNMKNIFFSIFVFTFLLAFLMLLLNPRSLNYVFFPCWYFYFPWPFFKAKTQHTIFFLCTRCFDTQALVTCCIQLKAWLVFALLI